MVSSDVAPLVESQNTQALPSVHSPNSSPGFPSQCASEDVSPALSTSQPTPYLFLTPPNRGEVTDSDEGDCDDPVAETITDDAEEVLIERTVPDTLVERGAPEHGETQISHEAGQSRVFTTFGEGLLLSVRPDNVHVVRMDWGVVYVPADHVQGRLDPSDEESDSDSSDDETNVRSITLTGDREQDRAMITELLEEEDEAATEHLRTVHEQLPQESVDEPALLENQELFLVGITEAVVDRLLVVKGSPGLALDLDSPIFSKDRKGAGVVEDVFGMVGDPMYAVRLCSSVEPASFKPGDALFSCFRPELAVGHVPGSDASNAWDEEPDENELDYSDDEKEMEAKAKRKAAKGPATSKTKLNRNAEAKTSGDGPTGKQGKRARKRARPSVPGDPGNAEAPATTESGTELPQGIRSAGRQNRRKGRQAYAGDQEQRPPFRSHDQHHPTAHLASDRRRPPNQSFDPNPRSRHHPPASQRPLLVRSHDNYSRSDIPPPPPPRSDHRDAQPNEFSYGHFPHLSASPPTPFNYRDQYSRSSSALLATPSSASQPCFPSSPNSFAPYPEYPTQVYYPNSRPGTPALLPVHPGFATQSFPGSFAGPQYPGSGWNSYQSAQYPHR